MSTIKVDTITARAGSGTVSLTSGNNLSVAGTSTFTGAATFGEIRPNNIASTSGTNAISISSGGVVTLPQSSQNAQSFRLSQDITGSGSLQDIAPFEEVDTDYTRVGSALWSVTSGGVFSCTTTGTFLCLYHISFTAASGGDEFDINVQISTNTGGSFTARARTFGFENGQKNSISNHFIFTISDASAFKLKLVAGMTNALASGTTLLGDSNMSETGITFVRLGVV